MITSRGNECVDIKENSTANVVEHNVCSHQQDPKSAGFDARGSGNTFRYNVSRDNLGAGVRLGGDTPDDGTRNNVYGNVLANNAGGGIALEAIPQGQICGNALANNTGADAAGRYGARLDPGAPCGVPRSCPGPAQVLDLSDWKITLPSGAPGKPREVLQPELAGFSDAPWFTTLDDCSGVQFRAAVNSVTTSGSSYPRSELREMTGDGTAKAGWSPTEGIHTLTVREAITKLPNDKPHVVSAQIHDADDDVTVFRLEGSNLYVTKGDDPHYHLVTDSYELGTVFEAKFVVEAGQVKAYYNGELETVIEHTKPGNYFKAGAYTQANCLKSAPCTSDNFGEVHVYDLQVSHS
ncbi:polysaccharide lyase family 7 protein [Streptomyces sp. NPDC001514]